MRTVYAWWIPLFAIALLAITGAALRATGDAPRVVVQRQESPPASGAALGSAAGAQGSNADGTSNDRSDTSEITGPPAPISSAALDDHTAVTPIDRSAIEARITALESLSDRGTAEQTELGLLKEAVKLLTEAETAVARRAEWLERAKGAPAALDAIRAELAAFAPPTPPDEGASRADLEAALKGAEAEAATLRAQREQVERDIQDRTARRRDLPELIATSRRQLDEISRKLAEPSDDDSVAGVPTARRQRLQAERRALLARLDALQAEETAFDATTDLVAARRELLARRLVRIEQVIKDLRPLVDQKRREEVEALQREARRAALGRPEFSELLASNVALAEELSRATQTESEIAAESAAARQTLDALKDRFERTRQKISTIGLTEAAARLLSVQRASLPEERTLEAAIADRTALLAEINLRHLEIDDEIDSLLAVQDDVELLVRSLPPDTSAERVEEVRRLAGELLLDRRQRYLEPLGQQLDKLSRELTALNVIDRETLEVAQRYREFISERILWARSAPVFRLADLSRAASAMAGMVAPESLRAAWSAFLDHVRTAPITYLPALLVALAALCRPALRRSIRRAGELVARASTDRFMYTLWVLLLTTVLAAQWPLVFWLLSRRFVEAGGATLLGAFGVGLAFAALQLLHLGWIVEASRPEGLAVVHLRLQSRPIRRLRQVVRAVLWSTLPFVLVGRVSVALADSNGNDALARTCFFVVMIVSAAASAFLWAPRRGVLGEWYDAHPNRIATRLRHLTVSVIVGLYLFLALLSGIGYVYTAFYLQERLALTWLLVLGLLLAMGVLLRWLSVTHRRVALKMMNEAPAATDPDSTAAPMAIEQDAPLDRLAAVSEQTLRLIRAALFVALLFGLWAIWANVLPALGGLRTIELWSLASSAADGTATTRDINVFDVVMVCIGAIIGFIVIRNAPGLFELAVLSRLPISRSGRYATTLLLRYVLVIAVVLLLAHRMGIGWGQVQWLAAAISVGLGFGLKEIFENFVSGLVVLFERPVRVGDTVTVGDTTGTVTRIRIRATVVRDGDNRELLVPNRELITGRLINWTLTEPRLRLTLPIGVAYGSDTGLVERVLLDVARRHPNVMREPAPAVIFVGFGDNALQFALHVHVERIEVLGSTRHDLNKAIDRAFRDAKIEMPFPQRDVHVRGPVRVSLDAGTGAGEPQERVHIDAEDVREGESTA